MRCPHRPGLTCPAGPCPGDRDPGACGHLAALESWRSDPSPGFDGPGGEGPSFRSRPDGAGRVVVGAWMPCLGMGGGEVWQLSLARHTDRARTVWAGAVVTEGRRAATHPGMAAAIAGEMPLGFGPEDARRLAEGVEVLINWSTLDLREMFAGMARPPAVVHVAHFSPEHLFPDFVADWLAPTAIWAAVSEVARMWIHPRFRAGARVVWNAVEPAKIRPARPRAEVRARLGIPRDAAVIGYIGRMERDKGADALAHLDAALPPDVHLVGVGAGAMERGLRPAASARLHMVGPDPDSGSWLSAFDRLLAPGRAESFGLTIAEGLAAGVPVIGSRAGIAAIVPGLVREVDPDSGGAALAAAVLADLADEAGARARAARGLDFARERLSADRFGREWTALILDAAGR